MKTTNLQLLTRPPSAVQKKLIADAGPCGKASSLNALENSTQRKLGYVLGFLPEHQEIPNKIEPR